MLLFRNVLKRYEVVEFTVDPDLLKEDKPEHQQRCDDRGRVGHDVVVKKKKEEREDSAGEFAYDVVYRSVG